MHKELETFKALVAGNISIKHIGKTAIKRTPGEVTEVAHN